MPDDFPFGGENCETKWCLSKFSIIFIESQQLSGTFQESCNSNNMDLSTVKAFNFLMPLTTTYLDCCR